MMLSQDVDDELSLREANRKHGGGRFGGHVTGRVGQCRRAFSHDSYDNQYSNGNNNEGYRQPLENEDSEKPERRGGGGYHPKRGDYFNGDAVEGRRNEGVVDDVVPKTMVDKKRKKKVKHIDSEKHEEAADTNKENTAEAAKQNEPEK
ncbi:hypothetical protein Tco_0626179 [Tanacetum coccineum]|uniref:Uncharacterized protein n=1 Tax=Tanacetum coccineum TaxID=301880 RepID=A0ABQ4WIU7_9ASTR